jgi:hypothetical protein
VILVVGSQKIVPDPETAFRRIREHVLPWEYARSAKLPTNFPKHFPEQESRADNVSPRALCPNLMELEEGLRAAKPMSVFGATGLNK